MGIRAWRAWHLPGRWTDGGPETIGNEAPIWPYRIKHFGFKAYVPVSLKHALSILSFLLEMVKFSPPHWLSTPLCCQNRSTSLTLLRGARPVMSIHGTHSSSRLTASGDYTHPRTFSARIAIRSCGSRSPEQPIDVFSLTLPLSFSPVANVGG